MSSGVDTFVERWALLAKAYEQSPRNLVSAAALIYTGDIRSEIHSVTAGGRLRGVGKNGANVGVRSAVTSSGTNASAIVNATGPLHLVESDTAAHTIPRTTSSRRRRTAAGRLSYKRESSGRALAGNSLLVINGQVITGPVTHPGTHGKHPFAKGVARGDAEVLAGSTLALSSALARIFG